MCVSSGYTESGRCDAGEAENVFGGELVGVADDRISGGDVEPERLTIRLARERTGHAIALALVDHSFVRDGGMLGVWHNGEAQEVVEVEGRCARELGWHLRG